MRRLTSPLGTCMNGVAVAVGGGVGVALGKGVADGVGVSVGVTPGGSVAVGTSSGDSPPAGWGGAVWKTLGQPIQNVSSRFGAVDVLVRRLRAKVDEGGGGYTYVQTELRRGYRLQAVPRVPHPTA